MLVVLPDPGARDMDEGEAVERGQDGGVCG